MRNYRSVASYVRDQALKDKVVVEDVVSKKEICQHFDSLRKDMVTQEDNLRDLKDRVADKYDLAVLIEGYLTELINTRKDIEMNLNNFLFREYKKDIKQGEL